MTFGEMLRYARHDRSMNGEELAAICGVHKTYISNVETGRERPPSAAMVVKMCRALAVDPRPYLSQAAVQKKGLRIELDNPTSQRLAVAIQMLLVEHPDKVESVCETIEAMIGHR